VTWQGSSSKQHKARQYGEVTTRQEVQRKEAKGKKKKKKSESAERWGKKLKKNEKKLILWSKLQNLNNTKHYKTQTHTKPKLVWTQVKKIQEEEVG
jgi:hypothetical protein